MGEKIRDIRPISIGNTSLMVELNEGYSVSQGRLIHIQNKKFRYLLTEEDFYHLSSMVLRSWSEFNYIKKSKVINRKENEFSKRELISEDTRLFVKNTSEKLQEKNVEHRVLDVQNNLVTLIVKEKDLQIAKNLFTQKLKQYYHPYGTINKYHFLYQMNEFLMYKNNNGVFIEVFCQLPCASITPKTWIPLDRKIQNHLWECRDIKNGVCWADSISQFIYHLCWAVFHNQGFSPYAKQFLSEQNYCLEQDEIKELLELVFFNYSPVLINYLKEGSYDKIIPNYYSFTDY